MTGRWDSRRNRWISATEDFADMAKKARFPDGSRLTVAQLRACFEETAAEPTKVGIAVFCRRILKGLVAEEQQGTGEKT
jgi:hypothetical protein